jgi:S1-C subfamily serine protease
MAQDRPFEALNAHVVAAARISAGAQLLGTAFITEGRIATVYHVVGGDDSNLAIVLPRQVRMSEYQDTADAQVRTLPANLLAVDPVRDLAVLTVPRLGMTGGLELGSAGDVFVGDEVYVLGYPHATSGRFVLTLQRTEVGAKILLDASGVRTKHLVLNTQTRPGQSGSPVINPKTRKVVAVLVGSYAPGGGGGISLGGIDPATLHQTTHAISAEYLGDMR